MIYFDYRSCYLKKNLDKEIRNGGWDGGGWGVRGNIKSIIKWKINRIFIM